MIHIIFIILYSLYYLWKRQNYINRQQIGDCRGVGEEKTERKVLGDRSILYLDQGSGCITTYVDKMHRALHLKRRNFIKYGCYLSMPNFKKSYMTQPRVFDNSKCFQVRLLECVFLPPPLLTMSAYGII